MDGGEVGTMGDGKVRHGLARRAALLHFKDLMMWLFLVRGQEY